MSPALGHPDLACHANGEGSAMLKRLARSRVAPLSRDDIGYIYWTSPIVECEETAE
jgi:hypothetical protein